MADGGGGEHRQQRSKGRRKRLLFVVEEHRLDRLCVAYLVFKINIKDMFVSGEEDWAALRSLPRPVARLDTLPRHPERLNLALVAGNIVGVSTNKRTVIHAGADAPSAGPDHGRLIPGGIVLTPLGTRLYAIDRELWPPSPTYPRPNFQALGPTADGSWSWRALPTPPRDMYMTRTPHMPICTYVTATMAAGARVWVSAQDRGTYSFDTARLAWRKEGDWELPFQGRGLVVPDLQGLCFAICRERFCLCAFDVPVTGAGQPPAARYVWEEETLPGVAEFEERRFGLYEPCTLAYLGDGKLCITWTMDIEHDQEQEEMTPTRFALFLMAVQLQVVRPHGHGHGDGELRLLKHKRRCYKMPRHGREGYVLQPSLG